MSFTARLRRIPWRSIVSDTFDRAFLVGKTVCFVHVISHHLAGFGLLRGPSMMPTINPSGELVLLDLVTHRLDKIRVGDIVIVRSPEKPTKVVAKRVLGLEGDSVSFLTQPAISTEIETVVVPKGHVWVQGDNIYDSRDSRTFGPVPYGLINGRVLLRVWPPERCGFIEHNVPPQQVASGGMEQNAISD